MNIGQWLKSLLCVVSNQKCHPGPLRRAAIDESVSNLAKRTRFPANLPCEVHVLKSTKTA